MSVEFNCGDPAGLAGYLYEECDAAERAAIEAHLAVCASCVSELTALGATRTALTSWTPPDAKLGFRITSVRHDVEGADAEMHGVLRPFGSAQGEAARWWQRPLPAWAQAAAALLIFAVGMSFGMRTGAPAPASAPIASGPPTAADVSTVSARDLAALEQRLRSEISVLRTKTDVSSRPQPVLAGSDAVMQRVRTLVAESEGRQQRELAIRLSQVLRDVNAQRRMDLLRIEQAFGQMEGLTRPELANQRQMINYLIKYTSAQRTPQD